MRDLLCRFIQQRRELIILMLQLNQRLLRLQQPLHAVAALHKHLRANCLMAQIALPLQLGAKGSVLREAEDATRQLGKR